MSRILSKNFQNFYIMIYVSARIALMLQCTVKLW